ncbi:nuclear transport factor 2 family protein [Agromyces aerolatus]|uniref:nuclear transport factor 2 family protein n=1 Tax=Agromyces sp. LY-1074 TaxID=3074080 RepID=UPI002862507C|nr:MULTISPECIES: nuclear transport factor 2 family protein [unclassified Agromyces]MDR5699744.1 nuclear transport factor 2 family protein [Agromyces sp. LY-1074]MDR5706040.1 nuclear transport factor 2 family protein [Agromyces sp. LY-1358]
MTAAAPDDDVPPFKALMRRYAFAYTASHDFSVADELMVDDYVLRMGEHEIRGREQAYKPATARQYRQYPGLGFTVHDLISNGDRAAMRFTEHGRSIRAGVSTSWRGISLYRWNGRRLTECRVEQDYCARTVQVETGRSNPVPAPALDPWCVPDDAERADDVARVREWLATSAWLDDDRIELDDEAHGSRARVSLDDPATEVLDLFGAGPSVAFHVRTDGVYRGGLPLADDDLLGARVQLFATGIVQASDGVVTGHAVTDRLSVGRRVRR